MNGTLISLNDVHERLAQCRPLQPEQEIVLPEFWLAKTPVTYRQWRDFLEETGHEWLGQWHQVVPGWRGTFL